MGVLSKQMKRTNNNNMKRLDDVHSETEEVRKIRRKIRRSLEKEKQGTSSRRSFEEKEKKGQQHSVFTTLPRRRETRNVFATFIRRKRKERTTTQRLNDAPSKERNKK